MNGIINVLKPPGMTSSNVVVFIRRLLSIKKVGHSGTLDPAAAGVLPIFCGSATRLCEYALADDKQYIGEIHFGSATDTQDAQGSITETGSGSVSLQQAQQLFAAVRGQVSQIPPQYSALKKDGKKLYEYARSGQHVDIQPRQVNIYASEVLQQTGDNRFLFKVECSKGTYIRTLCHDIGRLCGTPAHLSFLLRSRTGGYRLEEAITLDELQQAAEQGSLRELILPMDSAVSYMPRVMLAAEAAAVARNGGEIKESHVLLCEAEEGDTARLYAGDVFIGLCRCNGGRIKVSKVLG